jgi:hypothetical protein
MRLRWATIVILSLMAGCATSTPVCQRLESRGDWLRLNSPPDFVGASVYKQMYLRGTNPTQEDFVWYSNSSDGHAACLPGDRHGCGDFVWYFTGGELGDAGEIVVCGESVN